jgi:predicted CopG family antitoxin
VHDPCMAVKTITIDLEAYEILSRRKRAGQSFSKVIKEQLGTGKTGADLRTVLKRVRLLPQTLDRVEAQLRERRRNRPRAPRL